MEGKWCTAGNYVGTERKAEIEIAFERAYSNECFSLHRNSIIIFGGR
jgi:hypothetical protein